MTRRTLDILFSAGGLLFAALFLIVGLVLQNQASFASDYVAKQLGAEQIFFTPADKLNGEDKAPGGECLVTYGTGDQAARQLLTGPQAECYANQYIAFHLREMAKAAGYEGGTYATLGSVVRGELPAAVEAAQKAVDDARAAGQPTADLEAQLKAAQDKLAAVSGLRETMFQGETLRGMLLTTYGFSIFGERAGQVAMLSFAAAALLLILSIAGFIHAFRTPKDKPVLDAG
jgi:hypothetical protein